MKTSQHGLERIVAEEGEELTAYQDTNGTWTIGVGHTSAAGEPHVKKGMRITSSVSRQVLARDLSDVEARINQGVGVKLTQNQFDALVSLVFNIGGTAFASSSLLRHLNNGDYKGAADAFLVWNKETVNGKKRVNKGLANRRKRERLLFLSDRAAPAAKPAPLPAEAPVPTPKSDYTPEQIANAQDVVRGVQRKLYSMGYTEVGSLDPRTGDFDGVPGKLTRAAILAFQNETGQPTTGKIDAMLLEHLARCEQSGWKRKLPRNDAPREEIREVVPEAKAAWYTKLFAKWFGLPVGGVSVVTGALEKFAPTRDAMEPLREFFSGVPLWLWGALILLIAFAIYKAAKHGEDSSVVAYRDGARR